MEYPVPNSQALYTPSIMTPGPPSIRHRLPEPNKWIPVSFICSIMTTLYYIYVVFHCVPLLLKDEGKIECIVFHLLTGLMIICYVRCVMTSPGEVPDGREWIYVARFNHGRDLAAGPSVPTIERKVAGNRRTCKWCTKYKPDRAHHCRVCMTCVLKMDHHCPWIYNCVGFHNYKFFFLLLVYASLVCHLVFWTQIRSVREAFSEESSFIRLFMLLYGVTLAGFVGVLATCFLFFHIWLASKALTTIEFCEKRNKTSGFDSSAYRRGFFGNFKAVLGPHWYTWFLPMGLPEGNGLNFTPVQFLEGIPPVACQVEDHDHESVPNVDPTFVSAEYSAEHVMP